MLGVVNVHYNILRSSDGRLEEVHATGLLRATHNETGTKVADCSSRKWKTIESDAKAYYPRYIVVVISLYGSSACVGNAACLVDDGATTSPNRKKRLLLYEN